MPQRAPAIPLGPDGTIGGHRLVDTRTESNDVAALVARVRPPWMRDALCREPHPEATFFPTLGEDVAPAKAVCGRCAVRGTSAWPSPSPRTSDTASGVA